MRLIASPASPESSSLCGILDRDKVEMGENGELWVTRRLNDALESGDSLRGTGGKTKVVFDEVSKDCRAREAIERLPSAPEDSLG